MLSVIVYRLFFFFITEFFVCTSLQVRKTFKKNKKNNAKNFRHESTYTYRLTSNHIYLPVDTGENRSLSCSAQKPLSIPRTTFFGDFRGDFRDTGSRGRGLRIRPTNRGRLGFGKVFTKNYANAVNSERGSLSKCNDIRNSSNRNKKRYICPYSYAFLQK